MSLIDAIILGLVQGIAEFLPISSTGHLIIAREMLGVDVPNGLAVDATLHFATALAVILYFRKDLLALASACYGYIRTRTMDDTQRTLLLALVLGTVPAVLLGLLLEETMDTLFRSASLVAVVLVAGSGLFLYAEHRLKRYDTPATLTLKKGVVIGFFQALALLPGMSRSGSTISGGMLLGLSREAAARFAFLLSLPIILGAGGKKLLELTDAGIPSGEWHAIMLAALVAFASGIASIHYLLRFLKNHSLVPFVVYRVALALLVFAVI